MLKKTLFVALFALLPLAAFARPEMIEPEPVPVPAKVSAGKVEEIVKTSMQKRGWVLKPAGGGKVEGLYTRSGRNGGFSVKIQVSYNSKEIKIKYLESDGLDYEEEDGKRRIHGNYNKWIKSLISDFTIRLTEAEFAG